MDEGCTNHVYNPWITFWNVQCSISLFTCVTCLNIHLWAARRSCSNNNITLTQSISGLLPPNLCRANRFTVVANHSSKSIIFDDPLYLATLFLLSLKEGLYPSGRGNSCPSASSIILDNRSFILAWWFSLASHIPCAPNMGSCKVGIVGIPNPRWLLAIGEGLGVRLTRSRVRSSLSSWVPPWLDWPRGVNVIRGTPYSLWFR